MAGHRLLVLHLGECELPDRSVECASPSGACAGDADETRADEDLPEDN